MFSLESVENHVLCRGMRRQEVGLPTDTRKRMLADVGVECECDTNTNNESNQSNGRD